MLRRRETASSQQYHESTLPRTSAISSSLSSNLGTPLPMIRNYSVTTSNPAFHDHVKVVRSYLSTASSSSSLQASSSSPSSSNKNKSFASWLYYIPALLLMITPWLSPHTLKEDIQNYQAEIMALQQKQQDLVQQLDTMTTSIQDYNTKIHTMDKEINERYQELRQSGGIYDQLSLDSEQYMEMEKAEEGLFRRMDDLEKHIQKTSAKLVKQKFGSDGPYRVKVNVVDLRGISSAFVMEMAPMTEMPYAVYYFLQMVDQKLWDGLALMLNGGASANGNNHWMATTMEMDLRFGKHSWEGQRFENANLSHMSFTEHSTTYPPAGKFQYSVAFSGHPGGPSFYIRLDQDSAEESNSDIHQQSSTFAMVVEGTDVLQRYSDGVTNKIPRNDPTNNKHATASQHMQILSIQSMELL